MASKTQMMKLMNELIKTHLRFEEKCLNYKNKAIAKIIFDQPQICQYLERKSEKRQYMFCQK